MWFFTLIGSIYLTASCIIGMLSLAMISTNPEDFDAYRSDEPMRRIESVVSVMLLGPFYLICAMVNGNGKD
jgi:hypothetical protein